MIFNDGSDYATRDDTNLYIKTKLNNDEDIDNAEAIVEKIYGKYVMKKITDEDIIRKLSASEEANIFIWDDMKPMTYMIDK